MAFHWRLSDSKSPQVSRTLLSILTVFNNAVIWMVSTRPPTSKSSRPSNNPLVTVPKAPVTIGIIVIFIFHSFFNSLARLRYFIIIIIIPCEFFTPALTDGLSHESLREQVPSGHFDSTRYSGRPQQHHYYFIFFFFFFRNDGFYTFLHILFLFFHYYFTSCMLFSKL